MLVIGLTGGIGSGKSTVAKLFADKGITVIDTDQLARDVISPGEPALDKIVEKFGSDILLPDGSLNRAALRQTVFAQADDRIWLEKLLHPLIRAAMTKQAEAAASPYCIAVIPLLFETERNPLINRILVVDVAEEQQIQRAHQRDQVSKDAIAAILQAQVKREQRLRGADDVIYNDGNVADLEPQVEKLHRIYLGLST